MAQALWLKHGTSILHSTLHCLSGFLGFRCVTMLEFIIALIAGAAIGSYNAASLKDCFDDTFHLGQQGAAKATKNAGPLIDKAKANASPYMQKAQEAAGPYIQQAKEKAESMRKK